jgi:hypothetical protein
MWEKQSQAEAAATEARDATARAQRLLRQAHLGQAARPEDHSDGFNSMASSTVLQTGPPTPNIGSRPTSMAPSDGEATSSPSCKPCNDCGADLTSSDQAIVGQELPEVEELSFVHSAHEIMGHEDPAQYPPGTPRKDSGAVDPHG